MAILNVHVYVFRSFTIHITVKIKSAKKVQHCEYLFLAMIQHNSRIYSLEPNIWEA